MDLKVCADDEAVAVRRDARRRLARDRGEITGQYPEDLLALHGGW